MELFISRKLGDVHSNNCEKQWLRFPKDGSFTIGRSIECDLRLHSVHVSRNHAVLSRSEDQFMVKDLHSMFGVRVNDIKIESGKWHTLKEGDEIEFGPPEEKALYKTLQLNDRFVYSVKQTGCSELDRKPPGPRSHKLLRLEETVATATKRKLSKVENKSSKKHVTANSKNCNSDVQSDDTREKKRLKLILMQNERAINNINTANTPETKQQENHLFNAQVDSKGKVIHHENVKLENSRDCSVDNLEAVQVRFELEKSVKSLKAVIGENEKMMLVEQQIVPSMSGNICTINPSAGVNNISMNKDLREMERENEHLKLELEKKKFALEEIDVKNKKLEEEQKKIAQQLEEDFKSKYEQKEEELEMRLMLEKDMAIEECKAEIKEKASTSIDSVVNTMENELQCSICSELFVVSTTLNCAHTFCKYCITEWRNVRNICPVCRQPIETVTRSIVLDNYIDKVLESLSGERREMRTQLIEERKKLMEKKEILETSCQRSHRGRSRGRGRRNPGQHSGSSFSSNGYRNFQNNILTPVLRSRRPIVISSDNESDSTSDSDSEASDESDESHAGYRYIYDNYET